MTQIRSLSAYRRGKKVRLGAGKAMIVAVVALLSTSCLAQENMHWPASSSKSMSLSVLEEIRARPLA